MEQYYLSGSPNSEVFAPGLGDLQPGEELESTPWRKRGGWIADLARRRPRRARDAGRAPQADVPPAPQEITADALPVVVLKGLQVLFVHPSLDVRKQVATGLTDLGMLVSTCGQAEQAVLQILHERPDAVLAEIGAPEFDALSFCARLRDRVREIPVLLVAPPHGNVSEATARERGAADLLQRPIGPQQLGERVRQAVARARAGGAVAEVTAAVPHAEPQGDAQTRNEILRQELKIQSLFELSKNVVGCVELDELYQGFLLNAMGQLGLSSGVLVHVDAAHPERPLAVVARGISMREARELLDFSEGLGAHLLRAPQPLLLEEGVFPGELRSQVAAARSVGLGLACPMIAKGMPVGIALFGNKISGQPLTADDLVMLSAVCNFAGPALEGARLYSELQDTYYSTVRAFVWSLEAKDPYTRGHSQRVADYARTLGEATGMTKRDLDMLVFGAVLHDIGKIGVPERILNKPGPLTQAEWSVVREHPEMGARIVGNIDYLEPAVGSVLHHHERIDGRGYPYGLVGTDIELGARIVTVVDSFDAMTTDRPYRKAMDTSKAIQLLRDAAGRQFDPQLVERFIELLEKGIVTPGSDADPTAVPVPIPSRAS
jgi:response regulator RpfG family c-di-GMP phosphodiesterase